eukprot:1176862-Ditylum_brightwellii.AAC.1
MNALVHNGMADESNYSWPDVHQMLNTLGYTLSTEEYNLIFDNFDILYTLMRDNGDIPETLFDELEFPEDTTSSGEVVPRRYGISQKWYQHCKILSSPSQREIWKTCFSTIREKQQENDDSKRKSIAKKIQLSKVTEEKTILKIKEIMEKKTNWNVPLLVTLMVLWAQNSCRMWNLPLL